MVAISGWSLVLRSVRIHVLAVVIVLVFVIVVLA
jgi:hypothetical protein